MNYEASQHAELELTIILADDISVSERVKVNDPRFGSLSGKKLLRVLRACSENKSGF